LRLPKFKDIGDANNKSVSTWDALDLGIGPNRLNVRNVHQLSEPPSRKRQYFLVDGKALVEKGEILAIKLRAGRAI